MKRTLLSAAALAAALLIVASNAGPAGAQASGPTITVPNLGVRALLTDFVTPIGLAFLSESKWLVIEKNTGQVQVVENGAVTGTALDLAVNNTSERGLLGIALHPDFEENGFVYLFWSCKAPPPPPDAPFFPTQTECADEPELGADTNPDPSPTNPDLLAVPLLGNRVDRFIWDDSTGTLAWDSNLIKLRSFQNDASTSPTGPNGEVQPPRGNHDGGIIRFGPDGKLYVMFGDVGRRGQLQNLPSGPTLTGLGPTVPDDQFGGPQPDDAHVSGVIIRLNDDGSTPIDNPFFAVGASMGGEVGENIQKIFAYGIRNSFGMAFDPLSGNLWDQENGEDAFDEINLVQPGFNGGWIQIMGPVERVAEFKQIETTSLHHEDFPNLQQFRWGPERIADTPDQALGRLFALEGSRYTDPQFSWKHVLAPAAIGFLDGNGLGGRYEGNLFVGFSTLDTFNGALLTFEVGKDKLKLRDGRLDDKVADNLTFHDMTESESLLFGKNFGIVTDIQTGPTGNLFVVSLSDGAIYEIFRRR
jgi:aldose sugar dehydrogenase